MNALQTLQARASVAKLAAPAPSDTQVRELIRAAIRAADHGNLHPWRFLVIAGAGLTELGQLFVQAAKAEKPAVSDAELERFAAMPLRAPMIVVVVARAQEHPKVPQSEQRYSAAAAAQNLINAAYAMGFGAMWRTGEMAYSHAVETGLGLDAGESIVGFIYVGTPQGQLPIAKERNPSEFFNNWPAL